MPYALDAGDLTTESAPSPLVCLRGTTRYLCEEIAAIADRLLPHGLYTVGLVRQANTANEMVPQPDPPASIPILIFQIARMSLDRFGVEGFMPGAVWEVASYQGEFPTIEAAVEAIARVVHDRLKSHRCLI